MKVLVGGRGTIGRSLLEATHFDLVLNSDDIDSIRGLSIDLLVCAAPSGNRLDINTNPEKDNHDINQLISVFSDCNIKTLVLISTVDTIANPNTVYGHNRLRLETFVKTHSNYYILRPSTLVGKNIKKNVLFDLTNRLYLDKIDSDAILQWCLLDDIYNQIEKAILNNTREVTLVSEPITNKEIIDKFFSSVTALSRNSGVHYDIQPYQYTKQQIFDAIERYLK